MNKKRIHRTFSEMEQIVSEWSNSGESRHSYCTRTGLSLHVLNYWIVRIEKSRTLSIGFKEIKSAKPLESDAYMRLMYPDGRVLEFSKGTSLSHIKEVLSW
jgi:hypothetical protein